MTKYNTLTKAEANIILDKGTEAPFTGELLDNKAAGIYLCRQCNNVLYRSSDKFESHCGWPSFDDEIAGAVQRIPDADGRRMEIVCTNCHGHLGHVFAGENYTEKNTRHCVNSLSMQFLPGNLDVAYFASGCFWGTEYFFMQAQGVKQTTVGFMGGDIANPSYEQVCDKTTGHVETTRVIFDADQTSYSELVKLFFETHDFSQIDGQGPDIGPQYLSVIFYLNQLQQTQAEEIVQILIAKGLAVATTLRIAKPFYPAEDYHQQYYKHKGSSPYCHVYRKVF